MEGNINEDRRYLGSGEQDGVEDIQDGVEDIQDEESEFTDDDDGMQEDDEESYGHSQGEEGLPDFGGMEQTPLGGLYGLFKEIGNKEDTKKVSFLTNEELGDCEINVRDCENVALLAETFNHPGVARFFVERSRIITDTAMSRKGWFVELIITSKKYAARDSSSSIQNLPQHQKKSKWKLFSRKENQQEMNSPQE